MRDVKISCSDLKEAKRLFSEFVCDGWCFKESIAKEWSWRHFRFFYTFHIFKVIK